MDKPEPEEVLSRLRSIYEAESDAQLARALGLAQTTVANWRNRKSVPYEICVTTALKKGLSLDYIVLGKSAPIPSVIAKIDMQLLDAVAKHFEGLKGKNFPFAKIKDYEIIARLYNSWCNYFDKNPVEGEKPEGAIERAQSFAQAFLLIPEDVMSD